MVMERTGQTLPADFDDTLHARVFAAFERELVAVDGVTDVLEKLVADGVPYCVASSGSHERIRVGHRKTGLDRWFEDGTVFSAQDVGRGKPAPDLFLHAAERMGVAPERCVVVEDSPPRSAAASGGRDGRVRVHGDDRGRAAGREPRATSGTWRSCPHCLRDRSTHG